MWRSGLVSSTLQEQLDELRKGKSKVLDRGHTLIIGWHPDKIRSILTELNHQAIAFRTKGTVVILVFVDKEEAEGRIADMLPYAR